MANGYISKKIPSIPHTQKYNISSPDGNFGNPIPQKTHEWELSEIRNYKHDQMMECHLHSGSMAKPPIWLTLTH